MEGKGRPLVLCFGNPARQDDGLGPAVAERLERLGIEGVQVESNYQLCVEDAVAISEASVVIFVDAAVSDAEPYSFERIEARREEGFMSHSIAPEGLLALARDTLGACPEAHLLAIRGYAFEMFREGLTARASQNLERAVAFLTAFLSGGEGTPEGPVAARRSFS